MAEKAHFTDIDKGIVHFGCQSVELSSMKAYRRLINTRVVQTTFGL